MVTNVFDKTFFYTGAGILLFEILYKVRVIITNRDRLMSFVFIKQLLSYNDCCKCFVYQIITKVNYFTAEHLP